MPCPHYDIRIVKRSDNESAVAAAAYQSGDRLYSEYNQAQKYYPYKSEVIYKEILRPPHAPPEYADRNTLWNAAEAVEKQWNSQLARRIVLAIPRELPSEQHADLLRDYCREFFVSKGMIADFAIYDKGDGNPTPISCSPCGRWTRTGSGSPRAARFTILTKTAKESGSHLGAGKVTRRTLWTGTTRSMPKSGDRAGLTRPTVIWKPMPDRSALTCDPMPDKGLTKSPPSTWGPPPARWRRKASPPTWGT